MPVVFYGTGGSGGATTRIFRFDHSFLMSDWLRECPTRESLTFYAECPTSYTECLTCYSECPSQRIRLSHTVIFLPLGYPEKK